MICALWLVLGQGFSYPILFGEPARCRLCCYSWPPCALKLLPSCLVGLRGFFPASNCRGLAPFLALLHASSASAPVQPASASRASANYLLQRLAAISLDLIRRVGGFVFCSGGRARRTRNAHLSSSEARLAASSVRRLSPVSLTSLLLTQRLRASVSPSQDVSFRDGLARPSSGLLLCQAPRGRPRPDRPCRTPSCSTNRPSDRLIPRRLQPDASPLCSQASTLSLALLFGPCRAPVPQDVPGEHRHHALPDDPAEEHADARGRVLLAGALVRRLFFSDRLSLRAGLNRAKQASLRPRSRRMRHDSS